MASKGKLNKAEFNKLLVFLDFVFMDEYQDKASFTTFEKCISPFFKDESISYESIFKDLCGKKKKFLNMKRLIKAYLTYKSGRKMSDDCKRFFKKLFEELMKIEGEEILPERPEKSKSYTSESNKKRGMVTKLKILTGKTGIIRGMDIEYDDVVNAKMYDKNNEEVYHQSELALDIIENEGKKKEDEELFAKVNLRNEYLVRDSITHVYGTYTTKIEFLGFKTRTGKFYFEGTPKGKGFIFGGPNKQFQCCKFNIDHDETKGMTCFRPSFETTSRINENLKFTLKDMTQAYLKDDPLIAEETNLQNMDENDENLDKFILSAPVIDDSQFLPPAVKIVNQNPECNFENVAKKEERQYQLKNNEANEELETLSINEILNGSKKQTLRAGRKNHLRSVKKPKVLRKKVIPLKMHAPNSILKSKKNFRSLLNDLGNDIKGNFNKEKERLRGKLRSSKRRDKNEEEQSHAKSLPRLRGGKKRSNQNQSSSPFGFLDGIFDLFGGSSSSSSSTRNNSVSNQGRTSGNVSVEGFFDCFNDAGDDDIDKLFNMSDDDLMRMFYNQKQTTNSKNQYSQNTQSTGGYTGYYGYGGYNNSSYGYNNQSGYSAYGYGNYSQPGYGYSQYGYNNYNQYGYNNTNQYGYNNTNQNQSTQKKEQPKLKEDKEADKRAQTNWLKIVEKMKENQGYHILQTIGACIQAICALQKDAQQDNLSMTEKIRLYQILEENEKIVDFLSKDNQDPREVDEEEEPEEEIKGLDEIDYLNMEELNQRMQSIIEVKKTQKNKENIRKLEIIYNACVDRKNLLIKQEEEQQRQLMIQQQKINEEALKKQEEEARKKAKEEKKNLLDNLLDNEIDKKVESDDNKISKKEGLGGGEKMSETERQKILDAKPNANHVYRNQEFPDGVIGYRDPLFPPEKKTLCDYNSSGWVLPPDGIDDDVDGWEKFTWATVKDIMKHSYKVFDIDSGKNSKTIEDDDIIQGRLGDCYFLSAIAALAKEDVLVRRLFYNPEDNKNAYGVFYMMNGEWKLVIVDDYFPCTQTRLNKKFVFSNNNGYEIWVMLLEKAWAKINGNFARIGCGGQPHEVFEVTTEAFSECVSVPKKSQQIEELWNKLMRAQSSRFIMTAGTGVDDEVEEMGLATGHAYTLTHVYDLFPNDKKKRVRLCNLRNPWGNGEWTGDYCDSSKLWNQNRGEVLNELLRQMREYYKDDTITFENKDDGEFFMKYEDFIKYYVVLGICHINPKYKYKTIKISANNKRDSPDNDNNLADRLVDKTSGINGPVLTKFNVSSNNTDVYLRICQKNKRYKPKNEQHHDAHVLEYIMLLDSNCNYIISECNDEPTTCIRTTLNAGTYYIVTDINYRYQGHNHGYVISAYSDKDVEFEIMNNQNVDIKNIIRNASTQLLKKVYEGTMTEGDIDKTIREPQQYSSKSPENYADGGLLIYTGKTYSSRVPYLSVLFENTTSNKEICIETELTKSGTKRFEVYCDEKVDPTAEKFSIEIPPKSSKILLINKFDYNSKIGISYGMKIYGAGNKPTSSDVSDDAVFNQQASPIDSRGLLNSYYLQVQNEFILGIDNNSSRDLNMKLNLTGLQISKGDYQGYTSLTFTLKKQSRQTFRVSVIQGASNLSFVFNQA